MNAVYAVYYQGVRQDISMIKSNREFPYNGSSLNERRILKQQIAIEQSMQNNLSGLIQLKKFFRKNEKFLTAASKCTHMLPGQQNSGYYHFVFEDYEQRIFEEAAHCYSLTFHIWAKARGSITVAGHGVHLKGIYLFPTTILDYPVYKHFPDENPEIKNINLSLKRFYCFLDNFFVHYLEKDFPRELEKYNYLGWSSLEYNTFSGTKDYFDKKKNIFYGYVAELDLRYESQTYEGLEDSFKQAIDLAVKKRIDIPMGRMTSWENLFFQEG